MKKTKGKDICEQLKEIRLRIAQENEIEYSTEECIFVGECKGTCPRCDAELRYIENELYKRKCAGKRISIATVSLGVALSMAACMGDAVEQPLQGDMPMPQDTTKQEQQDNPKCTQGGNETQQNSDDEWQLSGIMPVPETPPLDEVPLLGEVVLQEDTNN
ncbi:MAG: hypothetical protein LBU90_06140 [Bacteroidales bacterium]|nr:hypothetical protein [Bacteroidales bacterium]